MDKTGSSPCSFDSEGKAEDKQGGKQTNVPMFDSILGCWRKQTKAKGWKMTGWGVGQGGGHPYYRAGAQ